MSAILKEIADIMIYQNIWINLYSSAVSRLAGPLIQYGSAVPVADCAHAGAVVCVMRMVASSWCRRMVMMVVGLSRGDVLLVIVVLARGLAAAETHRDSGC